MLELRLEVHGVVMASALAADVEHACTAEVADETPHRTLASAISSAISRIVQSGLTAT